MIDSVAGMMSAAPTPMTARLAINCPGEPTIAESADPTPNTTNPTWSAGRRPYLSPRLPIVRSNPANASE